jgi:hypothetical protein
VRQCTGALVVRDGGSPEVGRRDADFSVLILVTAPTRALFSRDEVSLTTPP